MRFVDAIRHFDRVMRTLGRLLHGMYSILVTYLLGWVVYVAVVALGFRVATEWAVELAGFGRPEVWWRYVGARTGIDPLTVRGVVYLGLHLCVFALARGLLGGVQRSFERAFDRAADWFRAVTADRRPLRIAGEACFTAAVTVMLVPFVLQPTLVANWSSPRGWALRGANLADGTASRFLVDSVVGEYRTWFVESVDPVGGVDEDDVETADPENEENGEVEPPPSPAGGRPMMDRWDPLLERVAGGDPTTFARLKAFMWVESGGRQFAVSHTGCAGLMQFCSGTARSRPFRSVFGAGAVYTCDCSGRCDTPDEVVRALETGSERPEELADRFPCEPSDARFDAEKSLRAAKLYIDRLAGRFGGNLYLMYVGYNSGPAVAARVWRRVGRDPGADLSAVERHLAEAMRPHFPDSASTRARSLVQTHLPKLRRAYELHLRDARNRIASRAKPIRRHSSSHRRATWRKGTTKSVRQSIPWAGVAQ